MAKKQETIYADDENNIVEDNEFIENEFINELSEWRENNEQSSGYRSEGY